MKEETKALEVSINGEIKKVCVPPEGGTFAGTIGNIPLTYMRAFVVAGNDKVNFRWQLPDIKEGESISFRMIDAKKGDEPDRIFTVEELEAEMENDAKVIKEIERKITSKIDKMKNDDS